MRILITGAGGFLGNRLAGALAERGELGGRAIEELVLSDLREVAAPVGDVPVSQRPGELSDVEHIAALAGEQWDSVFHMASYLTIHAEKDPGHAWKVNVEALRRIVDNVAGRPKVIFPSSIACYGGILPEVVDEGVSLAPQTTYGAHKAVNELLLADYSRHGRIDGRCLRLPIVLIRPGVAQPVVSDRVAAIAREALEGREVASPLGPEMPVPVVSAGRAVAGLIALHETAESDLPPRRAVNLPALTVTPREMAEAVARRGGREIRYAPEPELERIVAGWPARFTSRFAGDLGIAPDDSFDEIVEDYIAGRGAA